MAAGCDHRDVESGQVLDVVRSLAAIGVTAWLDGGWGIDALIGTQTRPHSDVDLVVAAGELPAARSVLETAGFVVIRDWLPTAIAFRHADGREVDLHVIEPVSGGGGDQLQLDGVTWWRYDAPVSGIVAGEPVLCCSLETQLRAHLGYEPREVDFADMRALADRFGCALPAPYDRPEPTPP